MLQNMIISVFDRVENIMGKGEIACTSNFSFSHNVFKRLLSQMRQKVSLYGNGFNGMVCVDSSCQFLIAILSPNQKPESYLSRICSTYGQRPSIVLIHGTSAPSRPYIALQVETSPKFVKEFCKGCD